MNASMVSANGIVRIDLAYQECAVAPAGNRFGDQFFGCAIAVHLGGIDERCAKVQAEPERCDLISPQRGVLTHAPGAETEGGYALPRAQCDSLHRSVPITGVICNCSRIAFLVAYSVVVRRLRRA